VDTTIQVLCVGTDPGLPIELEVALEGVSGARCLVHAVRDQRAGVEAIRDRSPDLIVVEMGATARTVRTFAEEAHQAAPDALIAATWLPAELRDPGPQFVEGMRAGIQDYLRRPLSTTELQQLVDRILHASARLPAAGGAVVSFVSNKGGVGKSTLAVNVACGLARLAPEKVLLIDASLQLGTCASMLDLTPATTITDAVREYDRLDETLLRQLAVPHESGLRLLAAPVDPAEAWDVTPQSMGRVLSLARRAFDHVIVDTFPLLDDVNVAILDLTDRVHVVTNATVPTVVGTGRLLQALERLGVQEARRRVVLNLNHPDFAGQLAPSDVASRLEHDIEHVVPYAKQLLTAVNTGRPYVLEASRIFAFGRVMQRLVADVQAVRPTSAATRGRAPRRPSASSREARPDVDLTDSVVVLPDSGRLPSSSGRLFPELVDRDERGPLPRGGESDAPTRPSSMSARSLRRPPSDEGSTP
jgi:pilus assembly protein CpaE